MDYHTPILLNESINWLNIRPYGVYIDCTLGGGGHTRQILSKLDTGRLISIDQDFDAIQNASPLAEAHLGKFLPINSNFANIQYIKEAGQIDLVDGIIMDLGVSSHQLDTAERGFSYNHDAYLDMRMDIRSDFSAYNLINEYNPSKLSEIIKKYGEEKWASRIAEFIIKERKKKPIETTFELVEIIKNAIPKSARKDGPHPAKRTFQAIRIEVNNELGILAAAIEAYSELLKPGGRICILTFHSLEDALVKHIFKKLEKPCTCPSDFPFCICHKKPTLKILTKKPITPTDSEIAQNHRARSAKLRVAEKI